jgi:hypothetical protein
LPHLLVLMRSREDFENLAVGNAQARRTAKTPKSASPQP